MVSIPDTCVFANHGALADRDLQHRNQVNSGRDYDVVADLDASIHLRFEIEVRIEENIFPKPDAAWTDHMGGSQHDHRFMQRGLQPRREPCVSEESPPHVSLVGGSAQENCDRTAKVLFNSADRGERAEIPLAGVIYHGCTGESLPPLVSRHARAMMATSRFSPSAPARRSGLELQRILMNLWQYQRTSQAIAIIATNRPECLR